MGGGGGKASKGTGSLPWWSKRAHMNLIDKAEDFAYGARGEWIPYPDARIAGFTEEELGAQQARRDMFDRGDPSQQWAADQFSLASGLGSQIEDYSTSEFTTDEMNRRMSPFMEGVINPQLREASQSYDRRLNQSQADSVARGGSIGSYRVGLEDSLLEQERAESLGDIRAAGQQSSYESALGSFNADRQAGISGLTGLAAMYGDMGTRASQVGINAQASELQRINELERAGVTQRDMNQAEMDLAYNDFESERDYPMRNMSWLSTILSGVPGGIGTTETTTPNASFASQLAALGFAGAGIGQAFGEGS
jgi:hypothetical protein